MAAVALDVLHDAIRTFFTGSVVDDADKANPSSLVKATTEAGFPSKLHVVVGKC
jgi:hypothetical protein